MSLLNTQQRNNAEKAAVELGFGSVDRAKRVMGMDTLTASPSAVNVVPPKIGTEGAALGGMIASQPDYTKQLTDAATASQQTTDQAFNGYLEGLRGKIGETQATAKAYEKKGGVDDLQKKLNTYDQQLAMEQNALRRRQEAIQKNAVGMSAQAISDEVARVERESLAKQADISIIRAGVAQDYSTAKAIADRAVAVQMEQQGNTIEALKLNYERNRDLFTTAEKRAFEAKQKDRENAYNEELTKKQEISDVSIWALQQGADDQTMYAVRNATDPAEAAKIAASYYAPILAQQRAMENEKLALERYRTYKDAIPKTPGKLSGIAQGIVNGTIDPDNLSPTQYGEAMNEIMASGLTPFAQSDKQLDYQMDRADRIVGMVDQAIRNVSGWTTGMGSLLSKIPATKSKDFQKQIDSIKANIGFGELQAMRSASPTGGALGQVAVQELEYLQNALGSLDAAQSPEQVRENLNSIKEHFNVWKATVALSKASPQQSTQSNSTPSPFTPYTNMVGPSIGTAPTNRAKNNDPLGIF